MKILDFIGGLQSETYEKYGVDYIPHGKTGRLIVLDLAKRIAEEIDPNTISETDLEDMTANNLHTARRAVEIVQSLNSL